MLDWMVSGALGLATGIGANQIFARMTRRSDSAVYKRVLRLSTSQDVLIAFPPRPPSKAGSTERPPNWFHVSSHDMLATNYFERLLTLAGWEDSRILRRDVNRVVRDDKMKNLLLVCSPKGNLYTREILDKLKAAGKISCEFKQASPPPDERWEFSLAGARFQSPMYDQMDNLREQNLKVEEGSIEDWGVLGRVQNPWNPEASVMIASGIGGIGTWGVAKFLRQNPQLVLEKAGDRDFLWALKIKYENWHIVGPELPGFFVDF